MTPPCHVTESAQASLPVVYVTCPDGHRTGTQKQSGTKMRCSRCWQEQGREVHVTVPDRDVSEPPRPAREKAAVRPAPTALPPPAPRPSSCRGCGAQAPAGRLPDGWMSVSVSADPTRTKDAKPYRRLGPYCCLACLAGSLKGLAGQTAGVIIRTGETADLRQLMTERPARR